MGEKAVLTVQAHVFQIDPETKKKWLPTSTSSVRVAYYHDPARKTYRIISIEGGKPLVNSTVTANMTFTKTSPKFGQWSDHRANTVYGLGFGSEKDLSLFAEKFGEAKSAAKILLEERKRQKANSTAATTQANNSEVTAIKEGSNGPLSPQSPSMSSTSSSSSSSPPLTVSSSSTPTTTVTSQTTNKPSANGSVSTIETVASEPKNSDKQAEQEIESLKFENNKLKVALASSAQNVKKWESELQTLRNNNAMLTTALEESTQHVQEWKRQLQKYKEECDTLRKKVSEMEEHQLNIPNPDEIDDIKQENEELKEALSAVQIDLEQTTEKKDKADISLLEVKEKLEATSAEKDMLKSKVDELQEALKSSLDSKKEEATFVQQKHKEIETKLLSLLSLQKELTQRFTD